jgi:hypothetical protein
VTPLTEEAALSEYLDGIRPALSEWEAAWRSAGKAIRIPGNVGGRKWKAAEEQMRRVAALEERAAALLATVHPPERLRRVHSGLIAALRMNSRSFYSNARDIHDGAAVTEWSTFKGGTGDALRFRRHVNDWRVQVKAESQRLRVAIPFSRLRVFRQSL